MWSTILAGDSFDGIIINQGKDGKSFSLIQAITPIKDENGQITHFVATGKDITKQEKLEERLNYLVYYDMVTGLPNRNLYFDRLNQAILSSEREKYLLAILVIDVDRFKYINDTYGSVVGDTILKELGKRLGASVYERDTVARVGSDEFGIVCRVKKIADVIPLVEKIIENAYKPIETGDDTLALTFSMGISVYPDDGKDAEELVRNADLSLAQAKAEGKNSYKFFTSKMNVMASDFVMMENKLARALEKREFVLYYQPYFDVDTEKLAGMEALIRWNSEEMGLVGPGKFIPVLEETGMIVPVGEWILDEACRQNRAWQDEGYPPVTISVNLSPVQFREQTLLDCVKGTLQRWSLDSARICLEITESAIMQDAEFTRSILEQFKDMGLSISIDDFGTGYSSLSYLKRFPIDYLKIDQSFVKDIAEDPNDASIVFAVISIAHNLKLKTIAEGVETAEHWKILRILSCDISQGYYSSRPVPAAEIPKFLGNDR